MKTLGNRMLMFAAGAIVLGTMAHAQDKLQVEVPFAFRAGTVTLPSGSYFIHRLSLQSATSMVLEDVASHRTVYASSAFIDVNEKVGEPSVVFTCIGGSCSLSKIKMASGTIVYPARKKVAQEQGTVSVVSIPMKTRTGE
jgi:hypothetical protein